VDTTKVPVVVKTSVLIFYTTAVATPEGEIIFYQDIYDHDQRLQASLDAKSRAP
jgi:murein L,D-transpeptidase YcbB/YkuD